VGQQAADGAPGRDAGGAAVGGHLFGVREGTAAHGARHIKKIDRNLCWSSKMRYRFIEDRCVDDPVTMMRDVLGVSPAGWRARRKKETRRGAKNRASWREKCLPSPDS